MSHPTFLQGNLIGAVMSNSAGSEDASYPLSNLLTYNPKLKYVSPNTTADQWVKWDFGQAITVDAVGIFKNNFATLAATSLLIKIECSSDNFAADTTVFYSGLESPSGDDDVPIVFSAATQSKRYWRIRWYASSALSAPPWLSAVLFGTAFSFGFRYDFGAEIEDKDHDAVISKETLSGTTRKSQFISGGRTVYRVKFSLFNHSVKASWRLFLDGIQTSLRPFYYMDSYSAAIDEADYVSIDETYVASKWYRAAWNNLEQFTMRSVIRS